MGKRAHGFCRICAAAAWSQLGETAMQVSKMALNDEVNLVPISFKRLLDVQPSHRDIKPIGYIEICADVQC